jgi:parallel beta-helix repeat protein
MKSFKWIIVVSLLAGIITGGCHKSAVGRSTEGPDPEWEAVPVRMRVWYVPDSASYASYDSASQVYDHDPACDSIFRRALQRAAANGGGRITMEPAVYPLSVTLQLCSNLMLTGDTDTTGNVLLQFNAPRTILEGSNISYTTLNHFGIRNALNRGGEGILLYNGSSHNLINDISVSNIGYNGINISDASSRYDTIRNSRIIDVEKAGIACYNQSQDVFIENNTVIRTGDHGIILTGGNDCRIKDNIVDSSGYYTLGGNNAFAHGIAIDGHSGAWPCSKDTIDGNRITNSGSAGIEVADGVSHVVINNNYVNNTGLTVDHDKYGIYFGGTFATGNDITIENNEVHNCLWEGIRVGGNSSSVGNTDTVKITGNTVDSVVRQGIIIHYAGNVTLSDNDVRRALEAGIELLGWSAAYRINGIAISNNAVTACLGPGIHIAYAANPVFTDNSFCGNGSASQANGTGVDNVVIQGANECLDL